MKLSNFDSYTATTMASLHRLFIVVCTLGFGLSLFLLVINNQLHGKEVDVDNLKYIYTSKSYR